MQTSQTAAAHDVDVHIKINSKTIVPMIVPVILALVALNLAVVYQSGSPRAAIPTQILSTSQSKFTNLKI